MVLERDAVTGNRIDTRLSIIRPREQPVGSLVDNEEHDVVGRLAASLCANRPTFLGLQVGTSEGHYQANTCEQSRAIVVEFPLHVPFLPSSKVTAAVTQDE